MNPIIFPLRYQPQIDKIARLCNVVSTPKDGWVVALLTFFQILVLHLPIQSRLLYNPKFNLIFEHYIVIRKACRQMNRWWLRNNILHKALWIETIASCLWSYIQKKQIIKIWKGWILKNYNLIIRWRRIEQNIIIFLLHLT